jgi:hypothetical protein
LLLLPLLLLVLLLLMIAINYITGSGTVQLLLPSLVVPLPLVP